MNPAARRAWWCFKHVAPWVLAGLVLTLVGFEARRVDWPAVWQALQAQSQGVVAAAAALSLLSYAVYATFDLIGRRVTRHRLPVSRTMGIAAISYAFNLNLGAWVGSLALRLRLYTRWGLPAQTVAQIVAYSMVTNWLGYLWVGGAVLLTAPPRLPAGWQLPQAGLLSVGLAMVAAALAYLALCRYSRRRQLTWRARTMARLAADERLLDRARPAVPRSVVKVRRCTVASRSSSVILLRATALSKEPSRRVRPRSADSALISWITTSMPARAHTSAMPAPIWPQPTTPTRSISGAVDGVSVVIA